MQHVRVGQHDVGGSPDRPALAAGRVAVVHPHPHVVAGDERLQLPGLVLRERLRREQVQRGRDRLGQARLQNRQVVAQRLAAARARHDRHVLAGQGQVQRLRLVGV